MLICKAKSGFSCLAGDEYMKAKITVRLGERISDVKF
jgi:hypothetical protein